MKHSTAFAILVVFGISLFGVLSQPNSAYATTFTTRAKCAGIGVAVSAVAPSSVQTSSTFGVTSVTSTSTAPNGITVNKIVSTVSAANATPTSTTGSWTGAGTGTFTARFPDFSLTATGGAGSQIKLTLNSIDLYVNGSAAPITCSVANGQLTASASGESLTVFTLQITAPAAATTNTAKPTSNASTTPVATTSSTSTQSPPTANPATASSAQASNGVGQSSDSTQQKVTVKVKDDTGKPLAGAKVEIDKSPPVYSNSKGVATFAQVKPGNHTLTVSNQKQHVVRNFNIDGSSQRTLALTVQMPASGINFLRIGSMLVACLAIGALLAYMYFHIIRHHKHTATAVELPTNPLVDSLQTPQPVTTVLPSLQPQTTPLASTEQPSATIALPAPSIDQPSNSSSASIPQQHPVIPNDQTIQPTPPIIIRPTHPN